MPSCIDEKKAWRCGVVIGQERAAKSCEGVLVERSVLQACSLAAGDRFRKLTGGDNM
jgi:hypothetical protein